MSKGERYTENIVEQELRRLNYAEEDFQFQGSFDEDIQQFLPSKKGNIDGKGRSEFIVRLNGDAADLLVVECKRDAARHSSDPELGDSSRLKAVDFAEDGVLHYMKGLRRDFNVIGLAVSGTEKASFRVSVFRALRGGAIERLRLSEIPDRALALSLLRQSQGYGQKTPKEIEEFAESLHDFLRDEMELSEAFKPLIVSGILLALKDDGFEASYRKISNGDDLAEALTEAIKRSLKKARVREERLEAMLANYQFIRTNKAVRKHLAKTISMVYRNVHFALQPHSSFDLLGNFYGEFLRYSGGDRQGLGIVLTPPHITELFAELADLDPQKSVVLDICAGTAGFLIASMANMISKAGANNQTIRRVKEDALVGIELDDHMFTLACANMIFRGDGKANLFHDDCLHPRERSTEARVSERRPNVAMLNPPYDKKVATKLELAFVKRALDFLEPNGKCIAIIPISCIIEDNKAEIELKRQLLEKHTLEAVMSMPDQLFPNIGVITSIVVFTAHKPHNSRKATWFGYWKEDGFRLKKGRRVERSVGAWAAFKKKWLDAYFNQTIEDGFSCKKQVNAQMEWCAEAYMETDYSRVGESDFQSAVMDYGIHLLRTHALVRE